MVRIAVLQDARDRASLHRATKATRFAKLDASGHHQGGRDPVWQPRQKNIFSPSSQLDLYPTSWKTKFRGKLIKTGNPRGRPKGSQNKRTVAREKVLEAAQKKLAEVIPGMFEGDSHALLMSVYKDPGQDWAARIDAAKAAIRFEKPSLAAIEYSGGLELGLRDRTDELDEDIRRAASEAQVAIAVARKGSKAEA